jgi:GNAT superfamily N-acetyltransferase
MTVHFRRGTADDVGPIAQLHHDVWHQTQAPFQPDAVRQTRDLDFFRSRVAIFAEPPLVVERNGKLIGFSGWDNGYIGQLYLLPSERGTGIGRELLARTEALIAQSGAREARLVVITGDIDGRQFYERSGWKIVSERPLQVDTPSGPVEVPAWHMAKTLSTA